MSFRRQNLWPNSTTKTEDAVYTIVLHPDVILFKAGGKIQGDVYICFKDTKEKISFDVLKIYIKQNVNLPEGTSSKKNVTSKVLDEQILVDRGKSRDDYDLYIKEINNSNEIRVPFEFYLPKDIAASFNSKQLTTCYELRAEITELHLCGDICDMSTNQPIEIKEFLSENFGDKLPSAQVQQTLNSRLVTFSANTNKAVYHTDDEMKIDILLDVPNLIEVMVQFEIVQMIELKQHSQWETITNKLRETYPNDKYEIIKASQVMFLENSVFSSQPSVYHSDFIQVTYAVRITAYIYNDQIEIEIPIMIEREHALGNLYQKAVSTANLPLLPLSVTVNELKSDGLQSYIPLKQSYENRRLSVRKGNLDGLNAILTIVSESYKPYTKEDKIKGYVYLKIKDYEKDLEFSNLLIILVGVKKNKNGSTLRSRNGEMFLYQRKVLKGDKNENVSLIKLSGKSGLLVVEFEFDLSTVAKHLPPSFNSNDVSISYELKADVFNLSIGKSKASMYTTLPIIIKEDRSKMEIDVSGLRSLLKLNGKEISIFLSTDKSIYQHNDVIQARINIDNKSKKQLAVKVQLIQVIENVGLSRVVKETVVSNPIILLILPRSKLLSTEAISLKNSVFHYQPTLSQYDNMQVSYRITVEVPLLNVTGTKDGVPIKIIRRYGHAVKELTREGYPLLPITLEYYGRERERLPTFLTEYSNRGIVKVMNSSTCVDRWKGWKVK
ncbi:uncharacterized protein LOC130641882 [Hydractinia symbiolongicarpus]|uniref:uncharacterized protein LOC130641882 n=1 Tax=Hydractinia symbiolongicarpus TaxID=13093 RepID=UPI00254B2DD8|nr:uncharacterized protein LOC130641882 [Hydractinia symbiolongicarpus]